MSTNAINKTLQQTYPVAVFTAVLTSAGLNLVHARGSEYLFFLQSPKSGSHHRTLVSAEMKSCTIADRIRQIKHLGTCPEKVKMEPANNKLTLKFPKIGMSLFKIREIVRL